MNFRCHPEYKYISSLFSYLYMQEMPLLSNNFGNKKNKKTKPTKATETKLKATSCVSLSVVFHSVDQLPQRLV